ncbi:MAG: ATP-binding cassette domain-containing protein [Rhizobiales bacterium]|nr:ATP-binding cassette domain-containing protein [Hyphomicrobiales bacterium]
MAVNAVEISQVTHTFKTQRGYLTVLQDATFAVASSTFVSVVGPSGCGKSTILRMISGLLVPTSGTIKIRGEPVTGLRTDVGFMFQSDALIPWRTAVDNIALPLKFQGIGRAERSERARAWIRTVGLEGFEQSYPHQLSGGMRKRVSLACTLVSDPQTILMDEPFSALDVQTRNMMENELINIWTRDRRTVVFVTHDLEEAIALSDYVVVLTARPGRVKSVHWIDLPRPRDILNVRTEQAFHDLYTRIWNEMRDEVQMSYAQGLEG